MQRLDVENGKFYLYGTRTEVEAKPIGSPIVLNCPDSLFSLNRTLEKFSRKTYDNRDEAVENLIKAQHIEMFPEDSNSYIFSISNVYIIRKSIGLAFRPVTSLAIAVQPYRIDDPEYEEVSDLFDGVEFNLNLPLDDLEK